MFKFVFVLALVTPWTSFAAECVNFSGTYLNSSNEPNTIIIHQSGCHSLSITKRYRYITGTERSRINGENIDPHPEIIARSWSWQNGNLIYSEVEAPSRNRSYPITSVDEYSLEGGGLSITKNMNAEGYSIRPNTIHYSRVSASTPLPPIESLRSRMESTNACVPRDQICAGLGDTSCCKGLTCRQIGITVWGCYP